MSTCVNAQVTPSQDLEVVTAFNKINTNTDFLFIPSDNFNVLNIVVLKPYTPNYFYNYINPILDSARADLYNLGYVYIRCRFFEGKYFYSLTPGTKLPVNNNNQKQ